MAIWEAQDASDIIKIKTDTAEKEISDVRRTFEKTAPGYRGKELRYEDDDSKDNTWKLQENQHNR